MNTARKGHFGVPTLVASLLLAVGVMTLGIPTPAAAGGRTFSRGDIKRAERDAMLERAAGIDRRPVLFIRIWNGSYEPGNPLGLAPGYRDDRAALRIVEDLDRAYEEGWRRIVLHTPTGAPRHAVLDNTLEEWWRRSPQWRMSMRTALKEWTQQHPDATIGVYVGLLPRNASKPTESRIARNLWPYLDAGIELFVFDASALAAVRDTFAVAQRWLRKRGAKAVMEAYPLDRTTQGRPLEAGLLETTPAFALLRFVDRQDPERVWEFDPGATEVWVGLGRDEPFDADLIRDFLDRGFVPMFYYLDEEERAAAMEIVRSAQ